MEILNRSRMQFFLQFPSFFLSLSRLRGNGIKHYSTLKMEAADSSETLLPISLNTQHNVLEYSVAS